MSLLDEEKVTMTSVDAGQVFTAGRFHSLVPISKEVTDTGATEYYSVAVVKRNTLQDVTSLRDLRGKKACFPGVGTMAGWVLPIYTVYIFSLYRIHKYCRVFKKSDLILTILTIL